MGHVRLVNNKIMTKRPREPYKIFFETLGNKIRWEIVHLLKNGPVLATKIARQLKQEQSLVSHHLRRLEQCGFVHVIQNGKERRYRLHNGSIRPLLKLMDRHINTICKPRCCR